MGFIIYPHLYFSQIICLLCHSNDNQVFLHLKRQGPRGQNFGTTAEDHFPLLIWALPIRGNNISLESVVLGIETEIAQGNGPHRCQSELLLVRFV